MDDLRRFRPDAPARLVHHPLYTHFGEPIAKAEARRRLGWKPDERVLLFFGYIRRYKGLDLLLRAMPEIHRQTGARLVVLGEFYEDRAPYDRIVADLNLKEIVRMTGDYVPSEAVGPVFCASDAAVLPYRSATQSGIIQVAYQLERPVICTRVGGLDEMLTDGDTGLLVPSEDEGALVAAVKRYFDEGLEDRLVAGLRREKATMGWDSLAAAIVDLAMEVKGKMIHEQDILDRIRESARVKTSLESQARLLIMIAEQWIACLRGGGKILFLGNGGSAADAQHMAAELSGRFYRERPGLAAVALSTNTSAITAIGNDYGYDAVFARQLEGLARPGDVVVGISTSGKSESVLAAMRKAREMGLALDRHDRPLRRRDAVGRHPVSPHRLGGDPADPGRTYPRRPHHL